MFVFHAHTTVKPRSGTSNDERMYDFLRMKMPDIKMRYIATPHINRANVMGQA